MVLGAFTLDLVLMGDSNPDSYALPGLSHDPARPFFRSRKEPERPAAVSMPP